jgi:hypothetical protein
LSEALARLHLDEEIRVEYVKEAHRLLQKSIIFVESEDIELEDNEEGLHSLTYLLTPSLSPSLTYSLTHLLTRSLAHRDGKSHGIYHRNGK